ncbi:polysaccharide biosynthesis tyrosine autokinase [Mucilaginibacter sabulilitoris]|uniref:non-specific protein-tyrosine kinase n=1 Tax=Mucilaginibacter sabulilitoris TaxID=1173583 RepID=A0ABZ0TGV7_9SPHI|nr:polysaccharide biosynthesis tyrosine autokinase [Mucilaginibacter sabulilitoris]WPU92430.1 polysaccharide biosynthesis tyrosine autokinase [Mucilaginibacter sabulilitoris]
MNFKSILLQFKNYWYLFAISLVLCIGLAYVYNTYATKQYLISSSLLLQQQPNNPDASSAYANGGVASALNLTEVVKNEGDVLLSRNLIKEVVQGMHLNIKLFLNSGFLATEIYDESPFDVKILNTKVDSLKRREYVIDVINNKMVHIVNEKENIDRNVKFGEQINLPQYNISLTRRPGVPIYQQEYSTQIVSEDDAIADITRNYDAEFTDKGTTTIALTLYYPNSKKGEVILQNLMNQYLNDNIQHKKSIIDSTINFINGRLAVVGDELTNVEKKYQNYRSSNNITDIDEQAKVLVGNASDNDNKYQQQQIQLSIIKDLKERLNDPGNDKVIPSSLNIQNSSFASSLSQYNELQNERTKQRLSYTETNPVIVNLDQQIAVVRHNLLQSIDSYKNEMELSSSGINKQNNVLTSSIRSVPGKQRTIMDYSRQQELKQQLYVYLLQKREETSMAKAADMPYSRIIDSAKSSKEPAKPIKPIIYIMSFFLGLIMPFGLVNTRKMMASKISSEDDIEQHTDVTIIGKIGHQSLSGRSKADLYSRSQVTESLRTLRTKLGNILDDQRSNVIMITSSINGEGKTFLTRNLGNTLAMTGKKVVLIELDLRKPKLSHALGINNDDFGFSNYVLEDLDVDSLIKPSLFHPNCFVVTSGPVVANASEILLSDKLNYLIEDLREKFDYVIIDSSPVGLVSDALIIQKHVDITIYVCRHNYTDKAQIGIINEIKTKDNVDNLYLVINDVNFSKAGYFGYGYGIGYGER